MKKALYIFVMLFGCTAITADDKNDSGIGGATGAGGSTCIPTITCDSIRAECGVIEDNGCGDKIECINTCNISAPHEICGKQGSEYQNKCCVPKSCQLQKKSCGTIDNGCGYEIECGSCNDLQRPYAICGGAKPNIDGSQGIGESNVCGGGCTLTNNIKIQNELCSEIDSPPYAWACSDSILESPPFSNCIYKKEINNISWWCCFYRN